MLHRIWRDAGTELLARFQYRKTAEDYAASIAAKCELDCEYAVSCDNDGTLKIFPSAKRAALSQEPSP